VNADEDAYYGYKLADNGVLSGTFGTTAADYSTTMLGARAETFVRSASATTPLFLYYTPFGPHAGINPTTAHPYPSDIGSYGGMPDVVYPSFNEADVSDKPLEVRSLAPMTSTEAAFQHEIRRSQLETLQSEDRMIVNLINALKQTGRWDSTLFIVASDNGLSLGEHRLTSSKAMPYEESVRTPLWVHMPGGIAHTDSNLVSLVDVAPTIASFMGFTPPTLVNGQSLIPLVRSPGTFGRNDLLIEELGAATTSKTWSSIRTHRYKYTEYANGDRELYDMALDPFELTNVFNDPSYASVVSTLSARLAVLKVQ
jgi:arylsulfatase A-like enzyme